MKSIVLNGGNCTATIVVNHRNSGVLTTLASKAIGCHDGMEMRSVSPWPGNKVLVYLDGALVLGPIASSVTSGYSPGLGFLDISGDNGIYRVDIGTDTIAPNRVTPATLVVQARQGAVDLSWAGATDNPGGSGIARYVINRNGSYLSEVRTSPFTDTAVTPGTTYNYSIYAVDYYDQWSSATTATVTVPPSSGPEWHRRGVRPTGAYWGALGENINMMSGNLNFSLPLVTAVGRGGWKLPLGLSYNSQNWKKDANGTFNSGKDIGYGYGWLLTPGKITPYYTGGFTLHHYTFTDTSGAEYVLDVNDNGFWRTKEGAYTSQKLWFPDGTFWSFLGVSGGAEPDAGTMYPTHLYDRNGNITLIEYMQGNQAPAGSTSGRILRISDVRAATDWATVYQFEYTTETVPHLIRITNVLSPSEKFEFAYQTSQTLKSPISPFAVFGTTNLMQTVTHVGLVTYDVLAVTSSTIECYKKSTANQP